MPHLLPTYHEIRGLVGSQKGTYFNWSVPTSLQYLPTNHNTLVVDLIYFVAPWKRPLNQQ